MGRLSKAVLECDHLARSQAAPLARRSAGGSLPASLNTASLHSRVSAAGSCHLHPWCRGSLGTGRFGKQALGAHRAAGERQGKDDSKESTELGGTGLKCQLSPAALPPHLPSSLPCQWAPSCTGGEGSASIWSPAC